MPNWIPNWEDVHFDHAAAAAAVVECETCARFLDGRHADLGPSLKAARAEWRGAHRDRFDAEMAALDREADLLSDELRATARRILLAADDARWEQAARVRQREQWQEEVRREQAAEAERLQLEAAARAREEATAREREAVGGNTPGQPLRLAA